MKKILKIIWRCLKPILILTGSIALVMVILAFTSAPFWTWYDLGVKKAGIHRPPDYIIVMGGSGMPGESGLIRCWYAAKVASHFTRARVIIALPGNAHDSLSSVNQMKKELELRGIAGNRIFLEDSGTNTRAQAMNVKKRILNIEQRTVNYEKSRDTLRITRHPPPVTRHASRVTYPSSFVLNPSSLLIVTSPEHLLRSVLTFKKAGFLKVDGVPAFEQAIESDITFDARSLGGRKFIPDIGNNITLRYQFWTQMNYEFLIFRELAAIAYYKLKGWI